MNRRGRTPGIGIFLLLAQLFQVGFNRIPPVTLSLIAVNTAIYLRLLNRLPVISQACISFHHVWYNKEWKRIVLSPFFHLDDLHLYFNMASFLWKGISLESRLGSGGMIYLISVFSVLTSLMLLVIDKCLSVILDDLSYLYTCAAGFSGVIFALKIVTTYYLPPGWSYVMMFAVPSRIACWVELILIQLLVPSASFTGHLAGILVGLLYVKGPLKTLMNSFGRRRQEFVREEDDEALQAAIRESLQESRRNRDQTGSNTSRQGNVFRRNLGGVHLSSEEIRQRRVQRFQS